MNVAASSGTVILKKKKKNLNVHGPQLNIINSSITCCVNGAFESGAFHCACDGLEAQANLCSIMPTRVRITATVEDICSYST